MKEETVKVTYILPRELLDRVKKAAERDRRSVNGEIVIMLEDWFVDRGGPVTAEEAKRILRERRRIEPVFNTPPEEDPEGDA
jgi:hypothetical protein